MQDPTRSQEIWSFAATHRARRKPAQKKIMKTTQNNLARYCNEFVKRTISFCFYFFTLYGFV